MNNQNERSCACPDYDNTKGSEGQTCCELTREILEKEIGTKYMQLALKDMDDRFIDEIIYDNSDVGC